MRDQYAGDVSDVLKFALLRALAGTDRRLGIAWYYLPGHDGRPDGRHREWQSQPAWWELDAPLCEALATLPEPGVEALEHLPIWPRGTLFHREPVPARPARVRWGIAQRQALAGADLVFLDPDNGLGSRTPKHATLSELRLLRRPGRALAFITFPGRAMSHLDQMHLLHEELLVEAEVQRVATLRTVVRVPVAPGATTTLPRQRWFTLVDADAALTARAEAFAETLHAATGRQSVWEHGVLR